MKQANAWTCYPTALAIITGIPVEQIIQTVGHDGQRPIKANWKRESFVSSEMAIAMLKLGFALTPIAAALQNEDGSKRTAYPSLDDLFWFVLGRGAVVVVQKEDRQHVMAILPKGPAEYRLVDPITGEDVPGGLAGLGDPIVGFEVVSRIAK